MGVRLVVHNFLYDEMNYTGTHYHDELINRDSADQHPIYAITGLQEVLNTIEANLFDLVSTIATQRTELINYTRESIVDATNTINHRIDTLKVLNDVVDSDSIDLTYDQTNKTIMADVKIYDDPDDTNSLILTSDGLYVPELKTRDTATIKWSGISYGYTLRELFDDGIRFSHQNTAEYNNIYESTEANGWVWDNIHTSFKQPLDTVSYNGIVTNDLYDNYQHSVKLVSTGEDNAVNGIILGFIFDENNNPHTLSAVVQRGANINLSYKFAIIYNFRLPGETLVKNYNLTNSATNWNTVSEGITLYATKNKNLVRVSATAWGYVNTNQNMTDAENMPFEATLNINLNDYSWGHYFTDKVRYGYSNLSQANSYFEKVLFYSTDQHSAGNTMANVKLDNTADNAIEVTNTGLFVKRFIISEEPFNALTLLNDGYYVQTTPVSVSDARLNGFCDLGNGQYYAHKSHSFIDVEQIAHGFSVGDFIYYDNRTNLYQKAIAIDSFDINIVGMVDYVKDVDNFEYICSGFVETDLFDTNHGYVQGMPLYISDQTAGEVTQEQPDISKAVGYPIEDIGLIISIERGIQYNQESSIGDFKTSANDYSIRSDGFIKVAEDIDYKYTMIHKLLDVVDQEFKDDYLVINQQTNTVTFQNVSELYEANNVPTGLNLFIKAF